MKKTTDQFKKEIYNLVGGEYTVLGEYINNKTKILMRHNCKECNNYEYEVRPNNFIKMRNRCPKCSEKQRRKTRKRTTDQFKKEVYNLVSDEYTILGEYENCDTKILIRHNCKECNNYEYMVTPHHFLQGCRCPKCAGLMKRTTDQFKKEVKEKVGEEYTVLGEYINCNIKILMRHNCKECNNYEFKMSPTDFLQGCRCPKCFKINKKTTDQFKQEVNEKVGEEYTVLGEYINDKTKILMRHNTCNTIFKMRPNNFLQDQRCPKCSSNYSKGNDYIRKYLINHNIDYEDENTFDTCKYKKKLPFDFYIPYMNLIIEYDGEQHFSFIKRFHKTKNNFYNQVKRDQIKNQWVKDNNMKLIRIGYKNYNKLEEILNEILLTNDFDPNNYNDIYMYFPKTKILFESGIYKNNKGDELE